MSNDVCISVGRGVAVKNLRSQRLLIGLFAFALVIRFAASLYLGDVVTALSGAHDELTYSTLGERFATGHGLTFPKPWYPWIQPNAPQSYFSASMSLYLAAVYAIFGDHPLIARLINSVLSALLVVAIYLLARRVFGQRTAVLSGVVAALYAYLVFYGVTLVTETPFMLAIVTSLLLSYQLVDAPSKRNWYFLGAALAVSVLFRMAVIFFVPILLIWILLHQRRQARMILIPIAMIVLSVLPFTARNYVLWGRFVLLESQFGHVFWNGNHPGQDGTFEPSRVFPIPASVLASHNDAVITDTLLQMGIQNVEKDPREFVRLTGSRLVAYFMFWPTQDATPLANLMRVWSAGLLLPLSALGVVLSWRRWRELAPIFLFMVVHTAVYAVTWTMIRYRVPVDAVLIPFGSYALLRLWGWMRGRFGGGLATMPGPPGAPPHDEGDRVPALSRVG